MGDTAGNWRNAALLKVVGFLILGLALLLQGCAPVILAGGGVGSLIATKQLYGRDRSMGQFIDDVVTQGRLNSKFNENGSVDFSKIDIKVEKGIVTLKGELDDRNQVDKAIEMAKSTEGVIDVKSELVVKKSSLR